MVLDLMGAVWKRRQALDVADSRYDHDHLTKVLTDIILIKVEGCLLKP